ncbi:hypothetical protein BA173_06400 [Rickettsia sp. MEAM1 (Bemisia tabaci)]|nr:hypothetical protein BA173_06400 [Rickettsia sp. MEAM1 (Bemisia tabaci)]ODA37501.1 hypothetical protein A8V33_02125 [Rickettsia sp. wb]ODA37832.1 hypothetical protein A8V34_04740 [Rickettsia sp. wq]
MTKQSQELSLLFHEIATKLRFSQGIVVWITYVIPAKAGIQKKKHKYSKFLGLKARFISLYLDPRLCGDDMVHVFRSTQQCLLAMTIKKPRYDTKIKNKFLILTII